MNHHDAENLGMFAKYLLFNRYNLLPDGWDIPVISMEDHKDQVFYSITFKHRSGFKTQLRIRSDYANLSCGTEFMKSMEQTASQIKMIDEAYKEAVRIFGLEPACEVTGLLLRNPEWMNSEGNLLREMVRNYYGAGQIKPGHLN